MLCIGLVLPQLVSVCGCVTGVVYRGLVLPQLVSVSGCVTGVVVGHP